MQSCYITWRRLFIHGNRQKVGNGATKSGVRKVCERFKVTNTFKDMPKNGKIKKTTANDDRMIMRLALKNRRATSVEIKSDLEVSGISVSLRTICRRLFENGLKARRPRKKPYFNKKQRKYRLIWAKEHKEWTKEDWTRIIWSDENKIFIFGSDRINYVRRRPGEDLLPQCTLVTMKHPISVMVWERKTRDAVVRIYIVDGILNAKKYQENKLETKLLPSIDDLFEGKTETFLVFFNLNTSKNNHQYRKQHKYEKYNLRYANYIGDGDTESLKKVLEPKLYEENLLPLKLECLVYVQKRLGSRLRQLRTDMKQKPLPDMKMISRKGRLTDKIINRMQNYLGMAMRQNISDCLNGGNGTCSVMAFYKYDR
ncbi:uncharacterized protein LOC136088216 [Hydra vulgaris]|uniref:Uncharacterized protein LOC136088216 n=1 Tax=Hydra vulgaris TaxID=6087 RepID=A0ABM4D145_HYDVU